MKKTAVLMVVMMLTVLVSASMANEWGVGNEGKLLLFQKCDDSGCPPPGSGPWPIIPDNHRWGQMKYNLWGDLFKFSFEGKRLLPKTNYTLIYYPDAWPGAGLICLGSGRTSGAGNIKIHGETEILVGDIPSGLPVSYDENFNPQGESGAVGAKIWLVLSDDVQCTDGTLMKAWNPTAYLFEGNLIVYQSSPPPPKDGDDD